jgi:hypothetical protein
MEGVLDDIQKDVQKLVKNLDRQVFDDMSNRPVLLTSPPVATAIASATGPSATTPSGHRVDMNTRDVGSRVAPTWTHLPANGMSHDTSPCVHTSDFRPPPVHAPPHLVPKPIHQPLPNLYRPPPPPPLPTFLHPRPPLHPPYPPPPILIPIAQIPWLDAFLNFTFQHSMGSTQSIGVPSVRSTLLHMLLTLPSR